MAFGGRRGKPLGSETELFEYAVGVLSRRMQTEAELARKLRGRAAPGAEGHVDAVLARLRELGYLSDARYAAAYSASRQTQRLGKRRVAMDLQARGVPAAVASAEVEAAFAGVDEGAQARAYLARKRVAGPLDERGAARVFRLLQRAGFSPRVIVPLLRELRRPGAGGDEGGALLGLPEGEGPEEG